MNTAQINDTVTMVEDKVALIQQSRKQYQMTFYKELEANVVLGS